MSSSTDQRIERFLKKKETDVASAAAQAQRTAEAKTRREELKTQVQHKWAEDTHIINGILTELRGKLSSIPTQFALTDLGAPPPGAIAVAKITGRLGTDHVSITLRVDDDGFLNGSHSGINVGQPGIEFVSTHKIAVLTAGKDQYEDVILKLLGID